jgi:hypothetical protein
MYTWLSYGNGEKGQPGADTGFFQRREFCFTLEGDIFVRYQSFKDGAELHQALRDKCVILAFPHKTERLPQARAPYGFVTRWEVHVDFEVQRLLQRALAL